MVKLFSTIGKMAAITGLYWGSMVIPVGWVTYLLTFLPCLFLLLASIACINDLDMEKDTSSGRALGCVFLGVWAVAQLVAPVFFDAVEDWPTWRTVIGAWGFALFMARANGNKKWYDCIVSKDCHKKVTHV